MAAGNPNVSKANKVEIYSTPFCAYCKMAKDYFKKSGIAFIEYDVTKDAVRRQEMLDKTHQYGVPVIIIDDKIVLGFDRAKIDQLLGLN